MLRAWQAVCAAYPYVTVEGCGGIVCPIRIDAAHRWYLTDLIRWLGLPSVIVSPAGLGSINAAALTAFYMKAQNLPVKGFIVNNYKDTRQQLQGHADGTGQRRTNPGADESPGTGLRFPQSVRYWPIAGARRVPVRIKKYLPISVGKISRYGTPKPSQRRGLPSHGS